MRRYIARRLLAIIPVMLLVSAAVFAMTGIALNRTHSVIWDHS